MTDDVAESGMSLSRRKFALGLAFASVAGVAAARQPSKTLDYLGKDKLEKVIPERFGECNRVLIIDRDYHRSRFFQCCCFG